MTISAEITVIANRIANTGKTPSVALIKSQLSKPVPLPTIIAVLKTWQHDAAHTQLHHPIKSAVEEEHKDNAQLQQLIAQAIAPLQQEVAELKKLVQQLSKQ
ncbi:hypothetical protein SAMN05216262_10369 [Colwellia chukchiensis]|uniref:KfrA N-terminal DNA-binding domain-containing protein n=1 Tax=Colwellia chukchiensis TaxID=641665 RepID=A0A1H7K9I7_9GAMM|nr:hypothetical protein [Colwellia chukchiensis]SEK83489.1 hypothetical protein SAMN05216262_10369 [Colwellia chukchiensis]